MGSLFLLIGGLGVPEIALIIVLVLVLFGGRKIPELMRGLGQGIREFNRAKHSIEEEIRDGIQEEPRKIAKKEEQKS